MSKYWGMHWAYFIGLTAGLVAGRQVIVRKYSERIAAQEAEVNDPTRKLVDQKSWALVKPSIEEGKEDLIPDTEYEELASEYDTATTEAPASPVFYNNIFKAPVKEEDAGEEVPPGIGYIPSVISRDEYEDQTVYVKREWTYYWHDNIVGDESNHKVESPIPFIGHALSNFGNGSDDPDIVYMRNDETQEVYEVTRVYEPASWSIQEVVDEDDS